MRSKRQKFKRFECSKLKFSKSASMLDESKKNLLIQIFVEVDDFMLAYESYLRSKTLPGSDYHRRPGPSPSLSGSEIMTLLIFYHQSGYRCFQYYYENCVMSELRTFFHELWVTIVLLSLFLEWPLNFTFSASWIVCKHKGPAFILLIPKNFQYATTDELIPIVFLRTLLKEGNLRQVGFMAWNCTWLSIT